MDFMKNHREYKIRTYAVVMLLLCALFLFTACNNTQATVNDDNTVTKPDNVIAKFLDILDDAIGAGFGWTVVVFTVILKTALSPLDFWQKNVMRKNAKAMERMKPKLEKLQKQYANNKEMFQQKQMQLYKEEKYSMLGACLPTILTLVIFILIFNGFNKSINYRNADQYAQLATVYEQTVDKYYDEAYAAEFAISADETKANEAGLIAKISETAIAEGQKAVVDSYKPEGWLWIKNISIADSWRASVPDYETFRGTGLGKLNVGGVAAEDYNRVMGGLIGTGGWGKNGKWNGFLILPLLSIVLSFLTQKLTGNQQAQPPVDPTNPMGGAAGANMKVMQYSMPIIFGVFALLYSSAFTIYLFASSLFGVVFQVVYNIVAKILDKREEDRILSTTFKK